MSANLFPESSTSQALEGTLQHIVYSSPESGWTVARLEIEGRPETVSVVGNLTGARPGETLRLYGEWVQDRRYGRQFKVRSYLSVRPSTLAGIEKYLSSGLVRGVGPVTAERLVAHFGIDTLRVIDEEPECLSDVPGLGRVRIAAIRKAWKNQRDIQDVMVFLQTHGVSASHAARIYKEYGARSVALVTDNPYRLARDIAGIGFRSADQIAQALGIESDSPRRIEAAVMHVLAEAADDGHCFLPRQRLFEKTAALLEEETQDKGAPARSARLAHADVAGSRIPSHRGADAGRGSMTGEPAASAEAPAGAGMGRIERIQLESAANALADAGMLVIEPDDACMPVYTERMHQLEVRAARTLRRLATSASAPVTSDPGKNIDRFEAESGLRLADGQRQAVAQALTAKVLVLTGGPGTGKTTLVRAVLRILERHRSRVVLCAPTGRAAKRLAEATRHAAVTMHRLLEWSPRERRFQRDASAPLDGDLFIVDETSMVDLPLLHYLLQAIPPRARLLLVGDVDQLPSVGPGAVLADVIESGQIATVRLTEIFRQDEKSRIVENAHRIREGIAPLLPPRGERDDFVFVERQKPQEVLATLQILVRERLPAGLGVDPCDDIQVLVPMNRGPLGTATLNAELQKVLNPNGAPVESTGLRVGDKVMQVRNNYNLEVFNGDIGRIEAVDQPARRVSVRFEERSVRYDFAELNELTLAYACTVHKSQGSEYPVVVFVLHPQHHIMLRRNLLYTAVTRAKRQVVLLGHRRALHTALRNARRQVRYTRLAERIRLQSP
ncbi:MAG: AAA family ATPase [Candidatus Krumholzibacteriia bacterium]